MAKNTKGPFGGGSARKPVTIDLAAEAVRKPADAEGAGAETASAPPAPEATPSAAVWPEREVQPTDAEGLSSGDGAVDAAPDTTFAAAASAAEPQEAERVTPAEPARRERRRGWFGPLLAAALLGGAVAAGGLLILDRAGILPPGQVPEADRAAADPAVTADLAALREEIGVLQQQQAQVQGEAGSVGIGPLQEQIAALEGSLAELRQQPANAPADAGALAEMQTRLAQLEQTAASLGAAAPDAALQARVGELAAQVEVLRAASGAVADPGPQLAQLGARLDALTSRLATLEVRPPVDLSRLEASMTDLRQQLAQMAQLLESAPTAESIAALEATLAETTRQVQLSAGLRPAVAAAALAAALQAGAPFTAELAALRALGLDEVALAALEPHAQNGLPTLPRLRAQFEAQVASLDLSSPLPAGTGTLDRLLGSARGLVEVRPATPTGGTDPGAIVTRIRGALDAGDLQAALAEWNTLPDAAKAALADWAGAVEARAAAEDLIAKLRSEALAGLGTQG